MRTAGIEDTAELLEKQLASVLSKMTLEEALSLARAFSHYLNLTGIAETHHRYIEVLLVNKLCVVCVKYICKKYEENYFLIVNYPALLC